MPNYKRKRILKSIRTIRNKSKVNTKGDSPKTTVMKLKKKKNHIKAIKREKIINDILNEKN